MIYTNLKDTLQNKNIAKKVQECIEYTNKNLEELKKLEGGAYDIELGIKMHVNTYETGTEEDKIMETHLKNLDVQIMLCGEEYVAFNISNNMKVEKTEEEKDLVIYSGNVLFNVLLKEGDVLILYPNDVHMPGLKVKESKKIKKLVFKVPLNEL